MGSAAALAGTRIAPAAASPQRPHGSERSRHQDSNRGQHANGGTAGLPVDGFADDPRSWSAWSARGSRPALSFDRGMSISWHSRSATVGAVRTVGGQDWSGYRELEIVMQSTDLSPNTRLRLIADDGTESSVRVPAEPHGRSGRRGWLEIRIDLGDVEPAILARIAELRIEHRPTGGRPGTLQIRSLTLINSRGLYGPSTFLDPALSTYDYPERNWSTIATRVRDQGFTAVHLIILDFSQDYSEIIDALRGIGLKVSLTIFPTTNVAAYNEHPQWRQLSLGGDSSYSWRVYLSPTNSAFVDWLHQQIDALMSRYSFDGLTLDEPWYEVWGGPYRDNEAHTHYMDISSSARQSFQQCYGFDPLPVLFSKDDDGVYYLTPGKEDSAEYRQWVQFRIDTINQFMRGIADVARAGRDIDVFLTYVADVRVPDGYGKSPEYQAQDIPSMQEIVQPQGVIFETAWQDWLQPDLDPDYVLDYTKAYVPQLEPGVVGFGQPDIGSVVQRDMTWVKEFSADCWTGGFGGYVIYEWSIGDWVTGGPPLDYGS